MSKYVTLHPTITTTTLSLAKSTMATTPSSMPTIYSTPYYKLPTTPHISVLIHKLKTSYSHALLPHLVGRTIAPRGAKPCITLGGVKIPATMTILSVTSTGIVKYFGYYHIYHYVGASCVVTGIKTYTSTVTITKLIKMLKSGSYTLL